MCNGAQGFQPSGYSYQGYQPSYQGAYQPNFQQKSYQPYQPQNYQTYQQPTQPTSGLNFGPSTYPTTVTNSQGQTVDRVTGDLKTFDPVAAAAPIGGYMAGNPATPASPTNNNYSDYLKQTYPFSYGGLAPTMPQGMQNGIQNPGAQTGPSTSPQYPAGFDPGQMPGMTDLSMPVNHQPVNVFSGNTSSFRVPSPAGFNGGLSLGMPQGMQGSIQNPNPFTGSPTSPNYPQGFVGQTRPMMTDLFHSGDPYVPDLTQPNFKQPVNVFAGQQPTIKQPVNVFDPNTPNPVDTKKTPDGSVDDPRYRFQFTEQPGVQNLSYAESLRSLVPLAKKYGAKFNLLDIPELRNAAGLYIGPNWHPNFQHAASERGVPLGFTGTRNDPTYGEMNYVNGHFINMLGEPLRNEFNVNLADTRDRTGNLIYQG